MLSRWPYSKCDRTLVDQNCCLISTNSEELLFIFCPLTAHIDEAPAYYFYTPNAPLLVRCSTVHWTEALEQVFIIVNSFAR